MHVEIDSNHIYYVREKHGLCVSKVPLIDREHPYLKISSKIVFDRNFD